MKLMNKLEKKLGRFAIKRLTLVIIFGQIALFFALRAGWLKQGDIYISYAMIKNGEIWRTFLYIFLPPSNNPVWVMFSWYIFYLMGSNLEDSWGELHYNIYILISIILTNFVALFFGYTIGTNIYLQSSIFLAFAFLNPDFKLMLFFVIPLKIKWIALFTWLTYLYTVVFGSSGEKLLIVASLINFAIFFYKDIYYKLRHKKTAIKQDLEQKKEDLKPIHKCATCGITEKDAPYMDFRYCSLCEPVSCYCEEHIINHTHIKV